MYTKESGRIEANDAVDRQFLNHIRKKSLMATTSSKKKKSEISHIFDDENNDYSTEAEKENIEIIVSFSSSDITILACFVNFFLF